MFSKRSRGFAQVTNALYRKRDALLARGEEIADLTSGSVHPTLRYPRQPLEAALRAGAQQAEIYRPDPLGQRIAREAVQDYYRREGLEIPASQIVLTPGTSVAYLNAFMLFADAGDHILCPNPTYPLFDGIAALCGARLTSYRLSESCGWAIDFDHLRASITPRTRAIILISPHNPTGAVASASEVAHLAEIAARHQIPIISDEVFCPFLFDPAPFPRPSQTDAPLVVTLNGFSKMFALPGMKIGWMALSGDAARVKEAMERLAAISDTFLPVNEAAQFAVPAIFQEGRSFLQAYQRAILERRQMAIEILSRAPRLMWTPPAGGFYLTFRIDQPAVDDEAAALALLEEDHILVHPGFFYDLTPSHLVMSFISAPDALKTCLGQIVQRFAPSSPGPHRPLLPGS